MSQTDQPWKKALSTAYRDPYQLLNDLGLSADDWALTKREFSFLVTQSFARNMTPGCAKDPLLRQVLPLAQEIAPSPGYSLEPLRESEYTPVPGLLAKYAGRVLLIVTGGCAIHCRYCFRQNFAYGAHLQHDHLDQAMSWIAQNSTIDEVILSGGDPLLLSDAKISQLLRRFDGIDHVKRCRIHSRLPVVLPQRLTPSLAHILSSSRLQVIMVTHINHAQELGAFEAQWIRKFQRKDFVWLNQSVLLKGVNDSAEALIALSHRCFEVGILPYYLHLLDPVQGAQHFAVSLSDAQSLHHALCAQLPGYLVPKLVKETPGQKSKSWMTAPHVMGD